MQYLFNNESDSEAFNNFKSQGTPRDHLTPSCSFGLENQINWSLNDANVTAQVSPHFGNTRLVIPVKKVKKIRSLVKKAKEPASPEEIAKIKAKWMK